MSNKKIKCYGRAAPFANEPSEMTCFGVACVQAAPTAVLEFKHKYRRTSRVKPEMKPPCVGLMFPCVDICHQ